MLSRFATAAAIAPLAMASAAHAQVEISNTRTTPILASTASSGSAADVTVTEDGSIELTSGAAITGDSDNDIVLEDGSAVTMDEADDGATGVLLNGGQTGDLTVAGAISITDDLDSYEDEDEDGDADGPYATGSGRYGIRLTGDGVRIGDILLDDTGSIAVEGEDSFGISIESQLQGALQVLGSISVVGDGSTGVSIAGAVDGDVLISGSSISATGEGVEGVSVTAPISGRLQIQSSVTTNGYRYTYQPTSLADLDEDVAAKIDLSDDTLYLEDLDEDDLLQAGSAVVVASDVAGGVLLGAAPTYDDDDEDDDGDGTVNSEDDDVDGDGILDENEGTASLITYGAAPALKIGADTGDVTLGVVGADDLAYGLVNEGSIYGYGIYDGVTATALQVGGGEGVTTIEGGIRTSGTIYAAASEADATGVALLSGAVVPSFVNEGSITASSTSDSATTATALRIAAGADVNSIVNSGTLYASAIGNNSDAVAIRDESGSVTSVTNTGFIYGTITAVDTDDDDETDDETVAGKVVAMDLSANTTGVHIVQYGVSDQSATDTDGDGVYDDVDEDDDGDGILDADDDEDNDDDNDGVYDTDEPYIVGDILLGSGADTVELQNGYVIGDIAFGDGADSFSISGGATYQGALSDSDGLLDISVIDGVLQGLQGETLNLTSLTVGENGELYFTVDPAAGTVGDYVVSGAANFADGSTISLHLDSLVDDAGQTFRLVTAGSLTYGDVQGGDLTGSSPYMIVSSYTADEAAGTINLNLRRRTTTEMALSGVETSAYDAFYYALSRDEDVMDAFLAQTSRDDFMNLYEQTLPDHSGGTLMSLASGIDAVTQALASRNNTAAPGEVSGWVQEINFYEDKDKTDTYGYRAEGFGVAGGVEKMTGAGAVGVSVALASSDLEDPESEAEENLSANLMELGLYWRAQGHGWTGWARGAVGYAAFKSTRTLVGDDVYLSTDADWDGYTLSAAGGLAYEHRFGRLSLRPEAYAEYFSLTEGSRRESGGGDAFDLEIEGRTGHVASATAALKIGYGFGRDELYRPEIKLGWKQILSAEYDETTARYVSGGDSFSLTGEPLSGGGPLLGLGFTMANGLSSFTVSGDAQLLEDYVRYSFLMRATFLF